MEDWTATGFRPSEDVARVVKGVEEMLQPKTIYLYNQRFNSQGETTGFKLCVVGALPEGRCKDAVERDIYLRLDSEVPFDVMVYSPEEWERILEDPVSFAQKIKRTGMVVHG